MEFESQAERSRSVSAQVTVSGMEISSAGGMRSQASETVTNLLSYSPSQLGMRVFIKSKIPVSCHWCSPKVSKSMKRLMRLPRRQSLLSHR